MAPPRIAVSVVSHGQNALVNALVEDLARCGEEIAVLLTQNIPDAVPFAAGALPRPAEIIVNAQPKGFGANHNAAFARSASPFFCVANPDLRLRANPFPRLVESLAEERVGAAGPLVRNPAGAIEDSARRFPTAATLIGKFFVDKRQPDYPSDRGPLDVDWVAGMFMLFRSDTYRAIGGFDEAYFMYYEDVDLCRRLRAAGKSIRYDPRAEVTHDARRGSRRDARLAWHHVTSVLRFLLSRSSL